MRHRTLKGIFASIFVFGCFTQSNAQQGEWQMMRLKNGMEAAYYQDSTRQLTHLGLTIRGGSSMDNLGRDGLAHLWEHLFFKGLPDSLIPKGVKNESISPFASTSTESNFFALSVPSSQVAQSLEIFLASLSQTHYSSESIEAARKEMVPEFQTLEKAPENFLESEMLDACWGKWAAKKRTQGNFTDVLQVGNPEIQEAVFPLRHTGNTLLAGSGPGNSDEFFRMSDSILGKWKPESAGELIPKIVLPRLGSNQYIIVENEFATQPLIMMSWQVPGPSDSIDTHLLSEWFCSVVALRRSDFSRRLMADGLASNYSWNVVPGINPTLVTLYILPDAARFSECLAAVHEEVARFGGGSWIGEEDMVAALRMRKLEAAKRRDQSLARLSDAGRGWSASGELPSQVAQPKAAEIMDFARMYIATRPHVAGLMLDSRLAAAIKPETAFQPPKNKKFEPLPQEVEQQLQDRLEWERIQAIRIYFEGNTFKPDALSMEALKHVASYVSRYPELRFFVNGYAEEKGDGVTNYKLSIQRSKSVRNILASAFGVNYDQLVMRAFGEAFPEYPDETSEQRAKNRRVTFDFAPPDAKDNAY